jgi:hypothetical protein
VKRLAPNFIITLCVYGNPEGRDFDNYLINNHLNGNQVLERAGWEDEEERRDDIPSSSSHHCAAFFAQTRLFDWIHIMAYDGYENDVTYVENYTRAPRRWEMTAQRSFNSGANFT